MRKITSLFVAALATISSAWADPPTKISDDLKNVDSTATLDVIVGYRVPPTDQHFARVHSLGGVDKKKFAKIPGAAFTLPASAIQVLASDPDVAYVSPDRKVYSRLDVTAATINAPAAWSSNHAGGGIGIAVLDSGIDAAQKDLGDANASTDARHTRIVYRENFLVPVTNSDGKTNPAHFETKDRYGHGTHVAGIIGGNGFLSTGENYLTTYKGVAPAANLIDFQVLDANGEGSDSAVIAAIEEAIDLKDRFNIRVINLSLGRPVFESFAMDPLCQAVEQAWRAGIVVVVAAGNDGRDNSFDNKGYGTINSPGNDPYVITVGAMNAKLTGFRGDDVLTTYSSKGPSMVDHVVKPDIMAPGNHISSLLAPHTYLPKTYPQNVVNPLAYETDGGRTNYMILNGTSMAAGVVTGAVGVLLSSNKNMTPDQVKAVLMASASKQFYTYTGAYYNYASLTYASHLQLVQAEQSLKTVQDNIASDVKRVQAAQNTIANAQSKVQDATSAYNTAVQAAAVAAANLAAEQPNLKQAQPRYDEANKHLQEALADLNSANNDLSTATAAFQSAQQQLAADQQEAANQQALITFLQSPDWMMQAQLQTMQSDPTQYSATQYDVFSVGAGYLDLNAALTAAVPPATAPALSPVAYVDPATGQVMASGAYGALCGNPALGGSSTSPLAGSAFCTASSLWNAMAMWDFSESDNSATNAIAGARAIWGASMVSGSQSVWASQSASDSRAIWGAQSVYGSRAIWGAQSVWGSAATDPADPAQSVLTSGDPQ